MFDEQIRAALRAIFFDRHLNTHITIRKIPTRSVGARRQFAEIYRERSNAPQHEQGQTRRKAGTQRLRSVGRKTIEIAGLPGEVFAFICEDGIRQT
jgi:hypothetical protein